MEITAFLTGKYCVNLMSQYRKTTRTVKRRKILGINFDFLDYDSALEMIEQWRRGGKRTYITLTNPHSVLLCHRDPNMQKATNGAGLTLPDGVGIIWAVKILGYNNNGLITGPDFMLKLGDRGRKRRYKHYFYGGAKGIAEKLAANLSGKYPGLQVADTYSPPFRQLTKAEDLAIVKKINSAKPDIVWVGLGAPKQEKWIADHMGRIDATVMIGIGAAFDFHSGNVKWAPAWIRKSGFEWLYRLTKEPGRMWRRNLDSPLFLAKVIWQRFMMTLGRVLYHNSDAQIELYK